MRACFIRLLDDHIQERVAGRIDGFRLDHERLRLHAISQLNGQFGDRMFSKIATTPNASALSEVGAFPLASTGGEGREPGRHR